MREVKILVEPFEFISLLSLNCEKGLNEHGKISVKGIISQNNARDYKAMVAKEIWGTIKLLNENNEQKTLFCGIVTELYFGFENQVNTLYFTLKTGSYLLDLVPHMRSFQTKSYTYDQVLDQCLAPSAGKYMMLDKQEEMVNRFLVQYKETDWVFIKRLAGYAGSVIIPECEIPGKDIYFGYRKTSKQQVVSEDCYRVVQDYENYEKRKNKRNDEISISDLPMYQIETREIYGLGETVQFQEKELVVGKIISRLVGQELLHTYILHTKAMGWQIQENNDYLTGVSLKANVVQIDKTKVFIEIQEDENKEKSGKKLFDFATVYSTPDGTGWYCMPEIGDEVRLAFPDNNEENAYVASCVHMDNGERINPDEKSWKNKQRKEILFTPEALILRNNKGMSIEISDADGIKIVSDKKIMLQAEEDISISSQAGVSMSGNDSVVLSQSGSSIYMNDTISINGGKILMN